MSGGGTRSGRRNNKSSATTTEDTIHGIPQSEIDKLRGIRGHLDGSWDANALMDKEIREDYKRVGKDISVNEAKDIGLAILDFTKGFYAYMQNAAMKFYKGEKLDSAEQYEFERYRKIREYTKIAPVYKGTEEYIYRGVHKKKGYEDYFNSLLKKKPGNKIEFDNFPSSFSTDEKTAQDYADNGGIVFKVPTSKIKNAVSIKGMSYYKSENEVLVSDNFKVSKITTVGAGTPTSYTYIEME